jgi:hypothetical protein
MTTPETIGSDIILKPITKFPLLTLGSFHWLTGVWPDLVQSSGNRGIEE